MKPARLIVAVCVLPACGHGAPSDIGPLAPGLDVQIHETFYDVNGATAEELDAAMLARGPRIGLAPLFAMNEWEVRWRIRPVRAMARAPRRRAADCRVESDVRLVNRTHLPRWAPGAGADPALQAAWDEFLAALRVHELGHRDLSVEAARDILRALRSVGTMPCRVIVARADSTAHRTLQRYRDRNLEYDRDTEYGRTQGVAWPPAAPWR